MDFNGIPLRTPEELHDYKFLEFRVHEMINAFSCTALIKA
jgi:hypothetical protein